MNERISFINPFKLSFINREGRLWSGFGLVSPF